MRRVCMCVNQEKGQERWRGEKKGRWGKRQGWELPEEHVSSFVGCRELPPSVYIAFLQVSPRAPRRIARHWLEIHSLDTELDKPVFHRTEEKPDQVRSKKNCKWRLFRPAAMMLSSPSHQASFSSWSQPRSLSPDGILTQQEESTEQCPPQR